MNPYLKDILRQPTELLNLAHRWRDDTALLESRDRLKRTGADGFLLTGMGASLYAAYIAGLYLQGAGIPAYVVETSELVLHGLGAIPKGVTIMVISQSGESVEIKDLLEQLGNTHHLVGVTNNSESTLGQAVDWCVLMGVQSDHAISVNTYTGLIALLLSLFSVFHNDEDRMRQQLEKEAATARTSLEDWQEPDLTLFEETSFVTLMGYGPSLANAWEGALLYKEGAKFQADGINGGQFRHGHIEVVEAKHTSLIFATTGRSLAYAIRLIDQILGYGGQVIAITDQQLEAKPNLMILPHPSSNDEFMVSIQQILPVQQIVYELAQKRGIEPGTFRNTTPVIRDY